MGICDLFIGKRIETKTSGVAVITEIKNSRSVSVLFPDTGFYRVTNARSVRNREIKDPTRPAVFGVGFIGVGVYKSRVKGVKTKAYIKWISMLQRCYDEKFKERNQHYKDATTCKEWHNFQSFAEWHEYNYKEGCELDKDIKIEGNKIYSPEACSYVSHNKNIIKARARSYLFTSPDGIKTEVYNLSGFCRENGLVLSGMTRVRSGERRTHKGWTKGE